MGYSDWFLNIEPAFHPQNEPHLVMVYDAFGMLLNSIG